MCFIYVLERTCVMEFMNERLMCALVHFTIIRMFEVQFRAVYSGIVVELMLNLSCVLLVISLSVCICIFALTCTGVFELIDEFNVPSEVKI